MESTSSKKLGPVGDLRGGEKAREGVKKWEYFEREREREREETISVYLLSVAMMPT